jgi:hypothetical protein
MMNKPQISIPATPKCHIHANAQNQPESAIPSTVAAVAIAPASEQISNQTSNPPSTLCVAALKIVPKSLSDGVLTTGLTIELTHSRWQRARACNHSGLIERNHKIGSPGGSCVQRPCQAARHFSFRNAIICRENMPHSSIAIHKRPPANINTGGFADSARKTCNARIPVVIIEPSTRVKPVSTKRRQGATEFPIVFMLNQTDQLQNRHAVFKPLNDSATAAEARSRTAGQS